MSKTKCNDCNELYNKNKIYKLSFTKEKYCEKCLEEISYDLESQLNDIQDMIDEINEVLYE